ncbi:MAG: ribosome assembly RNA-binding protein YhbY [Bacilli bacterium]|jgi:RNA-binding protein|nr:ribosome assembly RNA-binding protein YhbY [Bacilli bacterium]
MLNKKQIQYLRKLAHNLKPIFQIGKNGLSEDQIDNINIALENRELIKISILQNYIGDKDELIFDLVRLTKSELVQKIGRTIIVYKPSLKNRKIIL